MTLDESNLSHESETDAADDGAGGLLEVALLAYPIVLTQMSITAMGVVDSAIVGRLGAAPLGAVGRQGLGIA